MEYIYQSWIYSYIFHHCMNCTNSVQVLIFGIRTFCPSNSNELFQIHGMTMSKFKLLFNFGWAYGWYNIVLTLQINKHDWRIQVCVANIHIFTISVLAFLCTRKQDLLKWWKTRTARENCHKTKQEGRKKGRKKGCKHA